MAGINLFISLAFPTLLGFLSVALILKDGKEINFFEKLFLGYGFGLGFLSLTIFLIGILRIPYSLFSLTLIPLVSFVIILFLLLTSRKKSQGDPVADSHSAAKGNTGWLISLFISLIIIWIAFKIFFVVYEGFNRPLYSWDTWSDWSGGAKLFFYEKGLVLDPSSEYFFGRGYRRFLGQPLLSPLLQVWISQWIGDFHEIFVKAWSPFYFVSLLGFFFFSVKRESSSMPALIATFMLAGAPLLTYHATDGLSDLPMAYYFFAGAVMFWRYLTSENKRFLLLSGVFMGMSIFTKNEGLLYSLVTAISLIIYMRSKKKSWSELAYFALPLLLIAGPWLIFKWHYGLGFGHGDEFDSLKWEQTLHLDVFRIFPEEMFLTADQGIIFAFLLVLFFLGFRIIMTTNIKYVFLMVLMIIPSLLFLYVTTVYYEAITYSGGFQRNILTFLPVAFFIAAVLAYKLFRSTEIQS